MHWRGRAEVWEEYYDRVSGVLLDPKKVREARMEELQLANNWKPVPLFTKVPRQVAIDAGKKPIATEWIYLNKGDDDKPEYRSRLVGKEFETWEDAMMFAATPPLVCGRYLLSHAVTYFGRRGRILAMILLDVKRAFWWALAKELLFMELPEEDTDPNVDEVGRVNLSLYGTRSAARNWSQEYTEGMNTNEFETGEACPCNFYQEEKDLRANIHGDDLTILGEEEDVLWIETQLKKRWTMTRKALLGPEPHHDKAVHDLNRVITWTEEGIELEPDQRHIDLTVAETGMDKCRSTRTPGTKERTDEPGDDIPLPGGEATAFRGITMRANYLAQDRAEIKFAAKECAREMKEPKRRDSKALKRIARFLKGRRRLVQMFRYQGVRAGEKPAASIAGEGDTDHQDCKKTRKPTSGGLLFHGRNALENWSYTQKEQSVPSGESEYKGALQTAARVLFMASVLMKDYRVKQITEFYVGMDSSAAKAIAGRVGLGKLKHLDTAYLWPRQMVRTRRVILRKLDTKYNTGDLMTKHLAKERMEFLLERAGYTYVDEVSRFAIKLVDGAAQKRIGLVVVATILMNMMHLGESTTTTLTDPNEMTNCMTSTYNYVVYNNPKETVAYVSSFLTMWEFMTWILKESMQGYLYGKLCSICRCKKRGGKMTQMDIDMTWMWTNGKVHLFNDCESMERFHTQGFTVPSVQVCGYCKNKCSTHVNQIIADAVNGDLEV